MTKRTKKARKCKARKARTVKAVKTNRRAGKASTAYKVQTAFKQPFSALQSGFSSVMSYFK